MQGPEDMSMHDRTLWIINLSIMARSTQVNDVPVCGAVT